MKLITFDGTIETAFGKKLDTPLTFTAQCKEYDATTDGAAELKAANEWPTDSDIVEFVNARAKATARQKATTETIKAAGIVKPTAENDADLRLATMAKMIRLDDPTLTEEQALALALQFRQR